MNKSFTHCLHPVRIYNKALEKHIFVSCGKCIACQNMKRNKWIERLKEESTHWKYVMFFTLHYDDRNVPMLEKVGNQLKSKFIVRKVHQKYDIFQDNIIIDLDPKNDFEREYYKKRILYPYSRVEDAQKFIKRVRKNQQSYEKSSELQSIKFFMASEYGPTTFRPHYHGLFFTNSERFVSEFGEIICKSWTFGTVDYSLARDKDKCASYVAKYVVGNTTLPSCYQDSRIRPKYTFSRHSSIGFSFLRQEEICEILTSSAPEISVYSPGKQQIVNVPLPAPFENKLFPRFPISLRISDDARSALYRLYKTLGCKKWCEFKRIIQWTTSPNCAPFGEELHDYISGNEFALLEPILLKLVDKCFALDLQKDLSKRFHYLSLYNVYKISRTFCENMDLYNLNQDTYERLIDNYYKNKDYLRLSKQLEFEQEYTKKFPVNDLIHIDEELYYNLSHNNYDDETLLACASFLVNGELPSLEETFDYKNLNSLSNEYYKKSLKNKVANESFNLSRFNTTLKHFGFSYNKKIK